MTKPQELCFAYLYTPDLTGIRIRREYEGHQPTGRIYLQLGHTYESTLGRSADLSIHVDEVFLDGIRQAIGLLLDEDNPEVILTRIEGGMKILLGERKEKP